MSHQVEMTQHRPHSPTPEPDLDKLTLALKIMALDLATLMLSHPTMTWAAKEEATKKTESQSNPCIQETSAPFTDMLEWHVSFGMPTTASQMDWQDCLVTSS